MDTVRIAIYTRIIYIQENYAFQALLEHIDASDHFYENYMNYSTIMK